MKQFKLKEKPYVITDLATYNEAQLIVRENEEGLFRVIKSTLNLNLDTLLDSNKLEELYSKYHTIVETQDVLVKAHNF